MRPTLFSAIVRTWRISEAATAQLETKNEALGMFGTELPKSAQRVKIKNEINDKKVRVIFCFEFKKGKIFAVIFKKRRHSIE